MIFVAITLDDGSVRRMQCVDEALIDECVLKLPWVMRVVGYRVASPEEFPPNCRWHDDGAGRIVGEPIVITPPRDLAAEFDALAARIATLETPKP